MNHRVTKLLLAAALLLGIAALYFPRREWVGRAAPAAPRLTPSSTVVARAAPSSALEKQESKAEKSAALSGTSHVADELNAPGGTLRRDLEILHEVFATWQTNFPRTGNPVGENAEITAALAGDNPVRFAFIPRGHRAINARGELVDRWGTPFRFHQLSGTQMEIRSAGPDKRFGTADDAAFAPWSMP